jgi:transcriptional regulator with XRE-family HTH domain
MSTAATLSEVLAFDQADRLRKALRIANIGVAEMAEYLGCSRNSVGNWINGHVRPSLQTRRLWAMRTGVPFEWLETGYTPDDPECPRQDSNLRPTRYEVARTLRSVDDCDCHLPGQPLKVVA